MAKKNNTLKKMVATWGIGQFGLWDDGRSKVHKVVSHNRAILAQRYLTGTGLEVGALSRPLTLPAGVTAKYADRFSKEGLYNNFPEMRVLDIVDPDYVCNGETLESVPDNSQNFVIANHVIEHLENPLNFFVNAYRVLKRGGVLYFALPDKDKTFDVQRKVTTFEHILKDYREGPAWSREEHYRDYVRLATNENANVTWKTEAEYEAQVQKLMSDDYSIHFHVWDKKAVLEMVQKMNEHLPVDFTPLAYLAYGDECTFVLEKA